MTEPTPAAAARQSPAGQSAADLLGPQEVLAVQQQGHDAAFAAESPLSCPWTSASEPADIARRDMWIRGYAAGKTDLRSAKAVHRPPSQSPE